MTERPGPEAAQETGPGAPPAATPSVPSGPVPTEAALVPHWLDNLAALGWRVIAIVAFVIVLWLIATSLWVVTASIAVAIIVAAVLAPFVLGLRARGRSRTAAALAVWVVGVAVVVSLVLVLIVAFLPHMAELATSLQAGGDAFSAEVASAQLPPEAAALVEDGVEKARSLAGDLVGEIIGAVASAGTILILATFLVFFFLRDGDKAWLWCFQSLGPERLERITTSGDEALARVGGYLRGTTVLAAIIALTSYVFMWLLGVPLALPLAVLAFMTTYIPYFGGIVASIAIVLVTLGALGTGPAIVMLLLLGARTFLVSTFVRPVIYSRTVNLHPALVLVVLPVGLQLAGILGLFAAVPITALALTTARSVIDLIEPADPPHLPELVPAWLDRAAQLSWRALVAAAVIALLVVAVEAVPLMTLPTILALIFAATLQPVVQWLLRRGHARGRASAIAVLGVGVAIIGVLALSVVTLIGQADELGSTATSGGTTIDEAANGHLQLLQGGIAVGTDFLVGTILSLSRDLAGLGTVVLLSALLTFYFLRDADRFRAWVMAQTRSDAVEELAAAASRSFGVLGGYMTGTAAISFVGAASQLVIMVVLGLPLALPIFVLSFFGGFIPYIGSLLTTGLAFLIAVSVGDPVDVLVMGTWTLVFNLVQGNVVAPLVYNRTTHIHPAIVLVAIPAGSAIAGILGMFLVVPVLGVVSTTWRTVLHVMATGSSDGGPAAPMPAPDPATESLEASAGAH